MLCLLFFCRLVFCLGKAAALIRRAARTGQRSRSYRAAKMARAAPCLFVYILERRLRKSEERHKQDGERGTAKRRASCFLYIGKDACAGRRKWRGLRRSPSFIFWKDGGADWKGDTNRTAREARQSAGALVFCVSILGEPPAEYPPAQVKGAARTERRKRHGRAPGLLFLYFGKDACAERQKWHGLRRSPSFYYFVNVSRPYRQAISGRTRAAMTAARTPRRMSLLPGRNTQPTSVAQMPTSLCRYNSAMRK